VLGSNRKILKLVKLNQQGMTLPELMTAISLLAALSVSFLVVFTSFLVTTTKTNTTIEMTSESQNLLRILVEELRYGAGVRQTNSITDPNGPSGGWNTSNTAFVIITAVPALDSSNNYIINPSTGTAYLNEYVYYKSGTTLYKRTLANPSATGNKSMTSCPAASASSTCPADRKLAEI
jgi:prepilin-type N-terminal cleavage/methylation domain-containing protein